MERRLEGMNEFRDQLRDQAARFVTREEAAIIHERFVEDIRSLRESRAELQGKASMLSVVIAIGIGIASAFLAILGLLMK
jgi:hypothetical protein